MKALVLFLFILAAAFVIFSGIAHALHTILAAVLG